MAKQRVKPSRRKRPMKKLRTDAYVRRFSYARSRMAAWYANQPGDAERPPEAPNITSVTITGTPQVTYTLTCSVFVTGWPPPSRAYQWKADGIDIPGATSSTYTLTNAEIGALITCEVVATNSEGSDTGLSNQLGPVTDFLYPPSFITQPTITVTPA